MAKQKSTTKTVTRSATMAGTRTTTTNRVNESRPKKKSHGKAIAAGIVIIALLLAAAYLLANPILSPAQQQSQFESQLATMQNNEQNLTLFYLADAPNYNMPVNTSWSVQVTEQNPGSSFIIGQLTVSWNGQSKSLSIQDGIVTTGISPTYAVTLSRSEFMSFSQAVITRNTDAGLAYYSEYYLSGKLNYTRVN